MKKAIGVFAAGLLFALGVAACGGGQPSWDEIAASEGNQSSRDAGSGSANKKVLDVVDVGTKITYQYENEFGVEPTDFKCDEELVVEKGATYDCSAKIEDDSINIELEILSDDGDYTWKDQGA